MAARRLTVVSRLGHVEMLRTTVDSVDEARGLLVQRLTDHLARPDATARRSLMEARALAVEAVPGAMITVVPGWELLIGYSIPRPKKAAPPARKRKAP